jgi:hypothetical protein
MTTDFSGWAQAGLAGLIAALGTTFWAGQANTALSDARAQIQIVATAQAADHDKVIALSTDVAQIKSDASETKADVKTLLQRK